MAASVGLSVCHFHRSFKLSFGMTPYAYVLDARLRYAALLVERTNLALKDVAAAAGFFDQAHLGNTFRVRYGISPSQWRADCGMIGGPGIAGVPLQPSSEAITRPPVLTACPRKRRS
ncbi:helix-turn-helix transcriptional regulator [Luteibacter aegosomatissinici]|uniref:helix-turn-helix transcriptional regulator n=1 Tax=Luteibacter aegosomatissinici TaxID=2911539 RepID=UPI001FF75406|nr:helix-turn-helix transcriptional regulator [Luteibacter aegosomatissinici]UPG96707.1 helix-turn-helix transcriptional regulator [Luteibacter aegosomatissinici]